MTPGAPLPQTPVPPARRVRYRKKRRRHGLPRVFQDLVLPLLVLAAIAAIFGVRYLSHLHPTVKLPNYVATPQVLTQEYFQFEGKSLRDLGTQQQFDQAATLAGRGDFKGAILLLESISKLCAIPVVYHDLGLLYAQVNDHRRAVGAFREALARDPNYPPVRLSLSSLKGFNTHEADPVASEVEPNGTYQTANLISLDTPVAGEISPSRDVDFYRFSAPRAPRDILRIEVRNLSPALVLRLAVFDDTGRATGETAESPDPGSSLSLPISPKPNATRYLEVSGNHGSVGRYSLRVMPTRSFDRFEPNDDMPSAASIEVGQVVEANIMTSEDTDFYSFMAENGGNLVVTVQSQSGEFLPAIAIFGPDGQPIGFAIDATEQGQRISRPFDAAEQTVYYVQVWGRAKSSGPYILTVK